MGNNTEQSVIAFGCTYRLETVNKGINISTNQSTTLALHMIDTRGIHVLYMFSICIAPFPTLTTPVQYLTIPAQYLINTCAVLAVHVFNTCAA